MFIPCSNAHFHLRLLSVILQDRSLVILRYSYLPCRYKKNLSLKSWPGILGKARFHFRKCEKMMKDPPISISYYFILDLVALFQ